MAEWGVDLVTSRFIILQFEVKNISDMKPKNETEFDLDNPTKN